MCSRLIATARCRAARARAVTLDQNATQVMFLADRCFPALRTDPRFVEALLIPFHVHGKPVGTVWVVAHSGDRKFDLEDERIVRSLAQFASAGWQLLKASEAAAESNRNKDEFIAVLSHELRNPLGAIRLNAEALRRAALDPSLRACLERIDRQAAAITRIVEDIGEASRLAHRKVSIEREQLDLRTVLREVLEECQARLNDAKLVPRCEMPESPVVVSADQVRLRQIFDNLLSNANKFSEPGGVITVRLKADDKNASGKSATPAADSTKTRKKPSSSRLNSEARRDREDTLGLDWAWRSAGNWLNCSAVR